MNERIESESEKVVSIARPIESLSERELEVFQLIGAGQGTREIAMSLHLSVKTVGSYQENIKRKLALRSVRAVFQRAVEWRLRNETAAS